MQNLVNILDKNGLIFAFLVVGGIMYLSFLFGKKVTKNKIPAAAIAISFGLVIAYFGKGEKGIASIPAFSGMALLGGSMLRDFSIVSTAMGASFSEIKKAGLAGVISIVLGIVIAFFVGGVIAYFMGFTDAKSLTTIGAGACTFIVGPVTGAAVGASVAPDYLGWNPDFRTLPDDREANGQAVHYPVDDHGRSSPRTWDPLYDDGLPAHPRVWCTKLWVCCIPLPKG
jgi:malonate transporter MadM subunit